MDLLNKKINFHIHTKYSVDSLLEPAFIVDYLFLHGYNVAIITDHNTIKGALDASKYAIEKYGERFNVIIGEEVSTDIGDIIGFPIVNEVESGDYQTVIKKLKDQGAQICLPHPYKSHNLFKIHDEHFLKEVDFIEIFNSRVDDKLNSYALELADKFGKIKIVGNDAHVKGDLLNCAITYNGSFNDITITKRNTEKRNIRKSQIINAIKKRKIIEILKYTMLYFGGY